MTKRKTPTRSGARTVIRGKARRPAGGIMPEQAPPRVLPRNQCPICHNAYSRVKVK